jgi:hypothetical protein
MSEPDEPTTADPPVKRHGDPLVEEAAEAPSDDDGGAAGD